MHGSPLYCTSHVWTNFDPGEALHARRPSFVCVCVGSRDCRYRGVAVTVEDRDQTCMDVHDVMVLDPGVRCRDGCLLRGAVDSLQRGWEFSVQVRSPRGDSRLPS